jgi:hypothetical protein
MGTPGIPLKFAPGPFQADFDGALLADKALPNNEYGQLRKSGG